MNDQPVEFERPSRFRTQYRELTADEKNQLTLLKQCAEEAEKLIDEVPNPRYRALAHTALEEAVMWAVKGITG